MVSKLTISEVNRLTISALSKLSQGYYSESLKSFEFILNICDKSSPTYLSCLANLAYLNSIQKKYKKALSLLSKALSFKAIPSSYKIGLLVNLASNFSLIQNYQNALKYLFEALAIADPLNFFEMRSVILFNIAVEYLHLKKVKKALSYFQQGWNFSQTKPNTFYISKLLLEGCSLCLPEIHLNPDHKRTTSQNFLSFKQLKLTTKPFPDKINSASLRSIKPDFSNSLLSDCSSLISEQSQSILCLKKDLTDNFEYNKRIRKVKTEISKCLDLVGSFCSKGKIGLSEIFSDQEQYYLDNLGSIIKIQKFYRTKVSKNTPKSLRVKEAKFSNSRNALTCKVNQKFLKQMLVNRN